MSYTIKYYLDGSFSDSKSEKIIANESSIIRKKELRKEHEHIRLTKLLPVFLYLRFNNKTIKLYVDFRCTQDQWDAGAQEVNPRKFKGGAPEFNKNLRIIKEKAEQFHLKNLSEGSPTTKEDLKKLVDSINQKDAIEEEVIVEKHVEYEDLKKKYLEVSQNRLAHNTVKKIKTTFTHLEEFASKMKINISWELFNIDFGEDFIHYLYNKKKPLTQNSVSKYVKQLKTFLRYCLKHGIELDRNFEDYETSEKEREVYVLTKPELDKLYKKKFERKALNQVRDVFCFSCFTGLRFADVEALKRENIYENHLDLVIKKTQEHMQIPLIPQAKEILKKYKKDTKPLPVISNQKTNDYLKDMGKELKFNDPVAKRIFKRGKVEIEYLPKYEVLTFHVARKTFTTLSLVLGMSETAVKKITGHKSQKEFNKYVNLSKKFLEDEAVKAWG